MSERIDITSLTAGDRLKVGAGEGDQQYVYNFVILESGRRPVCQLEETGPDGTVVGPLEVLLEGSGRWTTPKENPVQAGSPAFGIPRQELAMSIDWGGMHVGSFAVIAAVGKIPAERAYLQPACTEIVVNP